MLAVVTCRLLLLAFAGLALNAPGQEIPAAEWARPPSAARLDALVVAGNEEGWGRSVAPLWSAAASVYEREPAAAAPWLHLYRWAALFAEPRAKAVQTWLRAVERAGGGHPNMAPRYELPAGSLAAEVSPALQRWLVAHPEFSEEFFTTLAAEDQPLAVLGLLNRLHGANPELFADYASLALAIALVYDVPPPPDWPHGQVSPLQLPRRLPDAVAAFNYWTRLDRNNVTSHRLRRLPARELKFVVDTSTPFADLDWARANVTPPLPQLAQAYTRIQYRTERVAKNQFMWPGRDYRLETILRDGGICVDQAYFAVQVGKARGIPTLLFRGAGLDGRHAWFGYLSTNGWVLDAGRYAEQRFISGLARDPQTWRELTDHELLFLSERFHASPQFELSVVHAAMAEEYLRRGATAPAVAAAREATRREPRNLTGWRVLLAAEEAAGVPARDREATLRAAMLAFQRYPDLEIGFGKALAASLRARGETSLATVEEQRLVRKFHETRTDLSVQQLADALQRSLATDDLAVSLRTYRRLLEQYGSGAGIDFFDKIVSPFVTELRRRGEVGAARDALERARRTLRVKKGEQLDLELTKLAESLRRGAAGG